VLARAFHTDPLFTYTVPDEDLRRRILSRLMVPLVRYGILFGDVFTTPDLEGIAIMHPPGKTASNFLRLLRSGMLWIPFQMPLRAFTRLMRFQGPTEEIRKELDLGEYWYLAVLGVDPGKQGRGIGGALIQQVLEKADRRRMPCYLETMNWENLTFYEKHGFSAGGNRVVPTRDGSHPSVKIWGMVRQPVYS
jgi:GNAT superfamily N-acetyltransferase